MEGKGHLRRLPILYASQPLYFITICVRDRSISMCRPEVQALFVREWDSSLAHYGWAVGSYVMMPEHVHFFCRGNPDAVALSKFVGKWKERTSKAVRSHGLTPPFWQKEFFDHVLRSDESYAQKWEYVANNPVRAGLAKVAQEWPYRGSIHFV